MIQLRECLKDDDISLAENANNPNVAAYMKKFFPSPYTLGDARWWIEEGHSSEGSFNLVIDLDGECIGNIGINPLTDDDPSSVEFGYWIGEQHWNKGITSKAISLFMEQVLSNHNVRKMTALIAAPNIASLKVLEKSGFKCKEVGKNSLEVWAGIFDVHVLVKNL